MTKLSVKLKDENKLEQPKFSKGHHHTLQLQQQREQQTEHQ